MPSKYYPLSQQESLYSSKQLWLSQCPFVQHQQPLSLTYMNLYKQIMNQRNEAIIKQLKKSERNIGVFQPLTKLFRLNNFLGSRARNINLASLYNRLFHKFKHQSIKQLNFVVKQGQQADKFFVILKGRVAILVTSQSYQNSKLEFYRKLIQMSQIKSINFNDSVSCLQAFLQIQSFQSERTRIIKKVYQIIKRDNLPFKDYFGQFGTPKFQYIKSIGQINYFGQLGLLSERAKRTSSIITVQDCQFAIVDGQSFRQVFAQQILRSRNCFRYLKGFFLDQLYGNVSMISSLCQQKQIPPLTCIWKQGELADYLLILKEGQIKLYRDQPKVSILVLSVNCFCGQQSFYLQDTKPQFRLYSAMSLSKVNCLQLKYSDLKNLHPKYCTIIQRLQNSKQLKLQRYQRIMRTKQIIYNKNPKTIQNRLEDHKTKLKGQINFNKRIRRWSLPLFSHKIQDIFRISQNNQQLIHFAKNKINQKFNSSKKILSLNINKNEINSNQLSKKLTFKMKKPISK